MGQYYKPVIFTENTAQAFSAHDYGEGLKLTEHSFDKGGIVFELYSRMYNKKKRIIWIGDYAQDHPLYRPEYDRFYAKAWGGPYRKPKNKTAPDFSIKGKFLVNHTKHEFVDFDEYVSTNRNNGGWILQPLPLLTAVGNGLGGGDYRGLDENVVGYWAGDQISVRDVPPKGYTKICPLFKEDW